MKHDTLRSERFRIARKDARADQADSIRPPTARSSDAQNGDYASQALTLVERMAT